MKNEGSEWVYLGLSEEELKEFVLSKHTFWQLSPDQERLSIGNYLLAEKCLSASLFVPADREKLKNRLAIYHQVRSDWLSNWRKKAKQEWLARFNIWQQYFIDLMRERENNQWNYSQEVRTRVILELLEIELGNKIPAQKSALLSLDRLLRSISYKSDFIWPEVYADAFPEVPFWYLYQSFE